MKIKRWNDFLSYIKESKEVEKVEEFNPWNLEEDDIRDYFQESIDEGYQIEVRYGFVGEERIWNSKESRGQYVERFTKKMESGNNTPAISILITSEKVSSIDVSDNLKFAYSIIAEEADTDISILDSDEEIGDIEGIIAKDGLFFTETWNNVEGKEPTITEADGYVEFLVKKKQQVKITQVQLAKYYDWGFFEEENDKIYVEYTLEDLADEIISRDDNYKKLLINNEDIYDNYWGIDYQPDVLSLFEYHLDKENRILTIKSIIKEYGGLKEFINHIGDVCDDVVYDSVKELEEDGVIEYLLKERFYRSIKQLVNDSDIFSEIKQSYGDWASNAHAEANINDIQSEFDDIISKNFTYEKELREVEKKSKFKDENGNDRFFKEVETFYKIKFDNDWIEDFDFDDLQGGYLTSIFEGYLHNNDLTRQEMKPYFSDYGNVDDKEWNKDVKSDLLRFLNK